MKNKNLVAKYARQFNKAAVHKDRKLDSKKGYVKHAAGATKEPPAGNKSTNSQTRIIGGQLRSLLLDFPAVDGLRPTGNRLRETLFNWLSAFIEGAEVIDLFAGSGALGFEAASRGAKHVTLIEKNHVAAAALQTNIDKLRLGNITLINKNALAFLKQPATKSYDIVFIDPPFADDLHNQCLIDLIDHQYLQQGAMVYIECDKLTIDEVIIPSQMRLYKQKIMGNVAVLMLEYLP